MKQQKLQSVLFASEKTRALLAHAQTLLQPPLIEETLMREKHGEYMLDAFNYDQLPRYFFGLELQRLKRVFSKICSTRDMLSKGTVLQAELSKNSDIEITAEQFMIAITEVIEVNDDNIVYVLNGAREMFELLCERNDGKNIRFNDFIQLYVNTQADFNDQGKDFFDYNKDLDYVVQLSNQQDGVYHQHDCKKIQVVGTELACLDYSSSSIRIYDSRTMTNTLSLQCAKSNHQQFTVINDFHYGECPRMVAAVFQDQSVGFWEWDDDHAKFLPEVTVFSRTLQLKIYHIESSDMWLTLSTHDELLSWDLVGKCSTQLHVHQSVCDIKELRDRQIVGLVTIAKSIVFYNNRLKERLFEIKGQVNFQNFIYVQQSHIVTFAYDNQLQIFKVDNFNRDATKLKQFGICQLSKMVLGLEAFEELELLATIDEDGDLKTWNLNTFKFIQKIPLKMQKTKQMSIRKLSPKRFVVMGKRLRFYEFIVVAKDNIVELKPFRNLHFNVKRETMYLATNFEIKTINLNNGSVIDNFNQETSNIGEELKGFFIESGQSKPFAFTQQNILVPVVYKEKLIQNSQHKSLERHLTSDIRQLVLVEETNQMVAVGKTRLFVYQIESNQSTVLQRTCDLQLDKLNEGIIQVVSSMKLPESQDQEHNIENVYKFVFSVVTNFSITQVKVEVANDTLFMQLSLELMIVCRYSDFTLIAAMYICPEIPRQPAKITITAKSSTHGSQKSIKMPAESIQIKVQLMALCRAYYSCPPIVACQYVLLNGTQMLIIAEETTIYLWKLGFDAFFAELSGVLDITQISPSFALPITTLEAKQLHSISKTIILLANGQGQLLLLDIGEFLSKLPNNDSLDLDNSIGQPIDDQQRASNKGRFALNQQVLLNAQPLNLTRREYDTKQRLQHWLTQADSEQILSLNAVDFEGKELIISLSKKWCKLWNLRLEPLGRLNLLTMEKEQWNIQMLNTTTKYTSLLRTKAKLESIFDNLVNVGFVDFDRLDSNKESFKEDLKQSQRRKHHHEEQTPCEAPIAPVDALLHDITQQIVSRHQRKQFAHLSRNVGAPTILVKSEQNRYLQHLSNKLNHIYNDAASKQHDSMKMELSRQRKANATDLAPKAKQSLPDYLDYLVDRKLTRLEVNKTDQPKQKDGRQRDLKRTMAQKQLSQDLALVSKFPKLNVTLIRQPTQFNSLSTTRIRYTTERQSQSTVMLPHGADDHFLLKDEQVQIEQIAGKNLHDVDLYLSRAKDLMSFLELKNSQLGING